MKLKIATFLFTLLSFTPSTHITVEAPAKTINKVEGYYLLKGDNLPSKESFDVAMIGFNKYRSDNKITKNVLTIIDFSLSSTEKRLWVINLDDNSIVYNTLVSHGKNTGLDYATSFSNISQSEKSSLGFFSTAETYNGKHGKSLRIDGLEKGKNDNARKRAVVIHGANYVSESFIKQHKRLGRSQGCPALPVDLSSGIIDYIKDQSCIFIYHTSL